MGWKVSSPDDIPLQETFTVNSGLKVEMTTKNLEDCFLNFDDRMFESIADQTNAYARNRITCGRDLIQQLDDPTNKKHNCLHSWKDLNVADINLFMAHVIVMSLVHKSAVHGYWSNTPFFEKYLSRNKFQTILWHFNAVSSNPAPGLPGHDPFACLRNSNGSIQL